MTLTQFPVEIEPLFLLIWVRAIGHPMPENILELPVRAVRLPTTLAIHVAGTSSDMNNSTTEFVG